MTTPPHAAPSGRRLAGAAALALATLLAGCATPFAPYTASTGNVSAIRTAPKAIELDAFGGTQSTVWCRARQIGPGGERPFSQFIRAAFADELVMAGPSASRDRVAVSVRITDVSVDCGQVWSSWTIEGEVRVADRAPFKVKASRPFDGSFLADVVQQRAGHAFAPTVQVFIAAVLADPAFKEGFGPRGTYY